MFVDQIHVVLKAGKGGRGCVSFRREYRVPKGGPDGGRGGNGGNVYLTADEHIRSLVFFRFHPINKAGNGRHGEGSNRQGKKGADVRLSVPVGTVVKEKGKNDALFDFMKPGQTFLAAKGGKGGRGNASYATSTHQTPREFEEGRPGEEKEFLLELKLIADVGLLGFPNVGKSTLISRISAARPVIADYPFTTLVPTLGVVDQNESDSFVVADIPGLIEGAHLGRGLGVRFLKHIERTKVLVHMIDVSPGTGRDPVNDYDIVMKELEAFRFGLSRRPQILTANKIDLLGGAEGRLQAVKELAGRLDMPFYAISALTGKGLKQLATGIAGLLREIRARDKDGIR